MFYRSVICLGTMLVIASCKNDEQVKQNHSSSTRYDTIWNGTNREVAAVIRRSPSQDVIHSILQRVGTEITAVPIPSGLLQGVASEDLQSTELIRNKVLAFADYNFDGISDIGFNTGCTASQCLCSYFISSTSFFSGDYPCIADKSVDGQAWVLDSKDGVTRDSLVIRFTQRGIDTLSIVHFEPISDSEIIRTVQKAPGTSLSPPLTDTIQIKETRNLEK